MELLAEAANEFGYKDVPKQWLEDAEIADVVIRCYVLNEALNKAIEEIKEENE